MKLLKQALPLSVMALALGACSSPEPTTNYDVQSVLNTANATWDATFNDSNADALAGLYAPQATLSAGDGNILNGRQEIAALFQGYFDNGLHNHRIETVETYAAPGQISQVGNWSADIVSDAGETITYQGVLVTVLQQNAQGEWEVASHVWNMAQ